MAGDYRFENHRGIEPLLWAFATLAMIELLAVHMFVSLKWPGIAWALTAMSLASIMWLPRWIRSFRRRPHQIEDGVLTIRMGSLTSRSVPLSSIKAIHTSWEPGGHKGPGILNLVPVAHPNRIIELREEVPGRRGPVTRIALRVDDPARFDAAVAPLVRTPFAAKAQQC